MQLTHRFTLPGPVAEVFEELSHLERLVACVPGATVTGSRAEVDSLVGTLAVKLGATPFVFAGTARCRRRDDLRHRLVIELEGQDPHRDGTAAALVTLRLTGRGQETDVQAVTRLELGGTAARYGSSVVSQAADSVVEGAVRCGGGWLSAAATGRAGTSARALTRLGARLLGRLS